MPPYDDWNKIDEEDEEELQDISWFEGKRDVILFCIDCSESMHELRDDPNYEDTKTSHLFTALEAAVQIAKKKVISGPNDSIGIMLFNTTRKTEALDHNSELKKGNFAYQPIEPLSAPKIQELIQLLDAAREDPNELRRAFPPLQDKRVPMGDVFTSCNWVIRDGAPKTATKRVFLITDEPDPHSGPGSQQLITSARTTLVDLAQAGVTVEPFFISTPEKPFDVTKFYSSVLLPTNLADEEEVDVSDPSVLPESISITRIEDLLSQMRFHEVPKRAHFSIPLQLAEGFTIGVKGYGLVTEQKKGTYKYFVDLGDRMEVATVKTVYVDEAREAEVEKTQLMYGMALGTSAGAADEEDEEEDSQADSVVRIVKSGKRPFYTAEDIRSFRTLGLEPGIKLLGFKDRDQLAFEDNIKHSQFIYPDEMSHSGSKRTFSALLKSMVKKKKVGLALTLTRRNATPTFCALLPQEERTDEAGWREAAGFHLIPLPFADDIRAATVVRAVRASDELKDAARAWIDKLSVKNGAYPPDSYPNPALAYHNAQLEASAFREEYDPDTFEDLTLPKAEMIHKRAGALMKSWKIALVNDKSADVVTAPGTVAGMKRKAELSVDEAEIRAMYQANNLGKMRVDQLKEFLKGKSLPVSGKKAELVERVAQWLDAH
ncbi:putative ku DNA-binding complex Ku70 subunit [Lyophyllum shimeji]|uniref:ATP-dependent DNA helicase II subunit 1 n=1 Tax=Lyophyllum shimeji TaxID=47721 RepID=A0A9P3PXB3_LYOSH|nr:putative ku DNA-binding complex Ku70 subunit [Lyophyllum shimeji]